MPKTLEVGEEPDVRLRGNAPQVQPAQVLRPIENVLETRQLKVTVLDSKSDSFGILNARAKKLSSSFFMSKLLFEF